MRDVIKKQYIFISALVLIACLASCQGSLQQEVEVSSSYESVEGIKIKMITENTEIVITLNASRAAADLVRMLPLELTLIERNNFAKGMTLPEHLSFSEAATREYEIGDFGYWDDGPDLAIFYDDIYEQTIVPIIPMGRAVEGAETMGDSSGKVRLELIKETDED